MGPPYGIRFLIEASVDFDPEAAAGADAIAIVVTKPSGAVVEWIAQVETVTADAITLIHRFAADELDERGNYGVWARFTLPAAGGELRTVVARMPSVLGTNQQT